MKRSITWRRSMPARRRWWKCGSSAGSAWRKPLQCWGSPWRPWRAIGDWHDRGWQGNCRRRLLMDPERWQKIEALYQGALMLDRAQRSAFLAGECGGDHVMRREVESLLFHDQNAGDFLNVP